MRRRLAVITLLTLFGTPCFAQGPVVAGVSATTAASDGRLGWALGATGGFQITPRWRAGFDVAHAPKLEPQFAHIVLTGGDDDAWTDVTAFLATVRVDLASRSARWSPFVEGGLGAARVTDVYPVVYVLPGPNPIHTPARTQRAASAGGGVSLHTLPRLSLDFGASWLGVAADPYRHIGRFGVAATYAF